jgi:hypothetical protein
MGNLSKLYIEGFRKFSNGCEFELSPITLFTGANNSGKSSILYALKLLNNSAKKSNFKTLDFSELGEKIGNFDLVKNNQSKDNLISFGFEFSNYQSAGYGSFKKSKTYFAGLNFDRLKEKINVKLNYKKDNQYGKLYSFSINHFENLLLSIEINPTMGHKINLGIKQLLDKVSPFTDDFLNILRQDLLPEHAIDILSNHFFDFYSNYTISQSMWEALIDRDPSEYLNPDIDEIFSVLFQNKYHKLDNSKDISFKDIIDVNVLEINLGKYLDYRAQDIILPGIFNFYEYFEEFFLNIRKEISNNFDITFWEEVKANEKRLFLETNKYSDFDAIINQLHMIGTNNFKEKVARFLIDWLIQFKLGIFIEINKIKNFYNEILIIQSKDNKIDLCDLGKGSQQIISILLNICLIAEKKNTTFGNKEYLEQQLAKETISMNNKGILTVNNFGNDYNSKRPNDPKYLSLEFNQMDLLKFNTIVLMEPEIYIHPNNQSLLAALIVDASNKFGIQFLIETHSEYMIRNLQVLTAANRIYSSCMGIYYLSNKNNDVEIKKVDFDILGNLNHEFIDGFFDESLQRNEEFLNQRIIKSLKESLDLLKLNANKKSLLLLVEDEYDEIYKISWLKLNDISCTLENFNDKFSEFANFIICGMKGAGAVAGFLRAKNIKPFEDKKIIGLFDFEKEGSEQFKHLSKGDERKYWPEKFEGNKKTCLYKKRTDHPCCYAILLPVPSELETLADLSYENFASYIEIENLLPQKFFNGLKFC